MGHMSSVCKSFACTAISVAILSKNVSGSAVWSFLFKMAKNVSEFISPQYP